jgi:hypothetical protein
MDKRLQKLFLDQIYSQCEFWDIAAKQTDVALNTINLARENPTIQPDVIGVFAAIQASLTAAANISKALWGMGGKKNEERKPLRVRLEIPEDSPLRPATMRDHFDHFDERLQRWYSANTQPRSFMDLSIVSPGSISAPNLTQNDKFRVLEPFSLTLTFWGDEVPLRQINSAIKKLLPKVAHERHLPI